MRVYMRAMFRMFHPKMEDIMSTLEKEVESRLRTKVKNKLGGMALKFVSPGLRGVPDRIVLLPGGRIVFVETKAPKENLRKLQKYVCELIEALGFDVRRIDTKEKVDQFILEMGGQP